MKKHPCFQHLWAEVRGHEEDEPLWVCEHSVSWEQRLTLWEGRKSLNITPWRTQPTKLQLVLQEGQRPPPLPVPPSHPRTDFLQSSSQSSAAPSCPTKHLLPIVFIPFLETDWLKFCQEFPFFFYLYSRKWITGDIFLPKRYLYFLSKENYDG